MIYIFNKYFQRYTEYTTEEWWMKHQVRYYRHQKTTAERRRYYQDKEYVRGKRHPRYLNPWGIIEAPPSCISMKSWKKLYKVRKQFLKKFK